MKKSLNSIIIAGLVAMISAISLAGCSSNVLDSEAADYSVSLSRAANTKTIYSDLNPGVGKAVFFAGTFDEGKKWTKAVRGKYVNGKWSCDVTAYSSFEYKALVGNWSEGETVDCEFPGLTKIDEIYNYSGYLGGPTGEYGYDGSNIGYGNAVYFFRQDGIWPCAYRGEYKEEYSICAGYGGTVYNSWILYKPYHYPWKTNVYVGSYNLGESVNPVFKNLTWESGENHIYK